MKEKGIHSGTVIQETCGVLFDCEIKSFGLLFGMRFSLPTRATPTLYIRTSNTLIFYYNHFIQDPAVLI